MKKPGKQTVLELTDASRAFAKAISESKPFQEYENAVRDMSRDGPSRDLLAEYQKAEETLRMMASWGGGSAQQSQQAESLRKEAFANPTLRQFFETRQAMNEFLQEMNEYLALKLGFDFASLAKPAGGCY